MPFLYSLPRRCLETTDHEVSIAFFEGEREREGGRVGEREGERERVLHTHTHTTDGWMTCDHTSFFNNISVISGRCLDDNEGLCAMELRLRFRRFHLV